jgi:hypothetical protein
MLKQLSDSALVKSLYLGSEEALILGVEVKKDSHRSQLEVTSGAGIMKSKRCVSINW